MDEPLPDEEPLLPSDEDSAPAPEEDESLAPSLSEEDDVLGGSSDDEPSDVLGIPVLEPSGTAAVVVSSAVPVPVLA